MIYPDQLETHLLQLLAHT